MSSPARLFAAAVGPHSFRSGEWTPTIQDENGNQAVHTVQIGHYIRVGDLVVVQGRVQTSSKAAMTGTYVDIGGLPFQTASDDFGVMMPGEAAGLIIPVGASLSGRTTPGAYAIEINLSDSAQGTTALLVSEWGTNGILSFNAHYKAVAI